MPGVPGARLRGEQSLWKQSLRDDENPIRSDRTTGTSLGGWHKPDLRKPLTAAAGAIRDRHLRRTNLIGRHRTQRGQVRAALEADVMPGDLRSPATFRA
jgi:hypothetical protein